ncbi:hypothetical protein I79_012533 [Cricetulus griseus]|uniref:Uncharacterized protein n=1 Tax=Cricetulus griseus TaxID=10029 RepID=G3HP29_CRIGR|nr:hypothetical protein I79_012533 [Cricetulus griseus]
MALLGPLTSLVKRVSVHRVLPRSGTLVRRSSFGKTFPSSSICILQTITSSNLKKRQCLVFLEFRKISLWACGLYWPDSPPKDLSPQKKKVWELGPQQ